MAAERSTTAPSPASDDAATEASPSGPEGDERVELLGLVPDEASERLARALEEAGEPSYRLEQLSHWIYERDASSFREITTLPTGLRSELAARFSLTPLEATYTARSEDGTVKHLWGLEDGEQVESVLIPTPDRLTLCLSSQAGCALGCRFCATGHFGFQRQLTPGEIAAQFRGASAFAREEMEREISNVVYMGMGEPMANLDAVVTSLQVLNRGFGVGARKITVSTVGLVPGIRTLARRPEAFGLAVSLHAPRHELRAEIMPVEKRFPLPELMDAVREYQDAKGRRVSFEYILIDGLNDSPELAGELAGLLDGLTCFVNLIPFNPIPDVDWEPSSPDRISRFVRELHRRGVSAAVREPRGRDIAAACGQLRLEKGRDGGGGEEATQEA